MGDARVERERRFLLAGPPDPAEVTVTRRIADRYLTGTRLRLRRSRDQGTGVEQYKLTQKIPAGTPGPVQGWITSIWLDRAEYDVLAGLPAAALAKTRLSVPPLGVDVFGGRLQGLLLAEAEFDSDQACTGFVPPAGCVAEVTADPRFTGGRLVVAEREELLGWLGEYGLGPGVGQGMAGGGS